MTEASSVSMRADDGGFDVVGMLREATRTRHEAVERLMPFFRPDFTVERYVRLLGAFLGVFEPLESELRALGGWESTGIDLEKRLRSGLLKRDLRHFGMDEAAIETLPRCAELFPVEGLDKGLGVLYVLEGSTLGGQVIARELVERFGFVTPLGISFFTSEGRNAGEEWRGLCAALRRNLVSVEARRNAVEAARLTFDCVYQWSKTMGFQES